MAETEATMKTATPRIGVLSALSIGIVGGQLRATGSDCDDG